MTSVAHESVAAARSEIEAVARRLLALRSEIDEILVGLVRPQAAPAGQAESAGEPVEEPMTGSATQITDQPDAMAMASEACTPDCIPLVRNDLTLISAIDESLSDRLNRVGIVAFSQIAEWSRAGRGAGVGGTGSRSPHLQGELDRAGGHPGLRRDDGLCQPSAPIKPVLPSVMPSPPSSSRLRLPRLRRHPRRSPCCRAQPRSLPRHPEGPVCDPQGIAAGGAQPHCARGEARRVPPRPGLGRIGDGGSRCVGQRARARAQEARAGLAGTSLSQRSIDRRERGPPGLVGNRRLHALGSAVSTTSLSSLECLQCTLLSNESE